VKCIEDEIPFELPEGWEWCRFTSVTVNRDSERKPISSANRTNVAKIYDYYGASGKIDKIDKFIFNEKLLLIGEDGANLVTRSKPIAFFAEGQYWVNNHAHCIDSTDKLILEYLCLYINAISLEKYVTGSAQPKMTQDNMNSILIALPPYEEQKRLEFQVNHILKTVSTIENENYFSYYCPLFDENDQCVGMVFAGKPSDYVDWIVWKSVVPILLLVLLSMIILIFVIWNYADHLNRAFRQLQRFLGNVEEGDFTVELSEMLTKRKDEIGQMAGTAVRMQHSLRDLVQRDSLTGLYNRHYGEIWMKQVKEEARDTGEPFSIAIADIDFFKKFNDCYGHDCGDMVLRKVSELLQTQVGRQGYVSRWGGEEFLIIFKRFTLEESVNFAEEIREKLHRTELRYHNDGFHVTLTIGVAAGDSEKSIESMVKCADCALYEGKRNGRDQVVCEKQKQSV